jgi:parallel beta-helix repeat protein
MGFFWACLWIQRVLLLLLLVAFGTTISSARTWHVPSEVEKIYEAVDSASYGDTVLVAPGTYYREREKPIPGSGVAVWIWLKDGVTITSEGGPGVTALLETAPTPVNRTVYGDSAVDVEVSGFTIDHGWPEVVGMSGGWDDAITLVASDGVIENNVVRDFDVGIQIGEESPHDGTPVIRSNDVRYCSYGVLVGYGFRYDTPLIEGNTVRDCDYGIWVGDSHPYILGNTIAGNAQSGIYFEGWSQSIMHSNKIIGNGTYGVEDRTDYAYQSPCLNCTFTKETANDVYGNALYDVYFVEETGLGRFEATYNYWGNLCPQPSQFYGRVGVEVWVDSTHTVVCTDCDNCHHSTESTTWGAIKALFE